MINHPNRSKLYTVLDNDAETVRRHLTGADAARLVLKRDTQGFEIRHEDRRYWLYIKIAGVWDRCGYHLSSGAKTYEIAERNIFRAIRECADDFHHSILSDVDYDTMEENPDIEPLTPEQLAIIRERLTED